MLDGLRLAGVESDSVKKCVLSISHILGTSTYIQSIISPKTLPSPVKSGDCNIRQPGRGLRVYSLAGSCSFTCLMDIPSAHLLRVKQALCLLPGHTYTADKP